MKNLPYKKIFYNAFTSAALYGTWAYIANEKGALISSMTQASMSFFFTFFIAFYLELIHRKVQNFRVLLLYITALLLFLMSSQVAMHYVVDTQNIITTVLPSFIIGTIYITVYVIHLKKSMKKIGV